MTAEQVAQRALYELRWRRWLNLQHALQSHYAAQSVINESQENK